MKLEKEAIGLIVVALIVGAVGGYFVGGSAGGQVTQLQAQVASLTSQINSLQAQATTLQSQITWLQGVETTLHGQITSLQGQVTSLRTNCSRLVTENAALRLNITTTMVELARLRAIHAYTVGSTLTTFSGGYETKTGPIFHIPAGNVKVTIRLTSLGQIMGFYVYLYKEGQTYSVWYGRTENSGTYENYVYSLVDGDYYLKVDSVNFNWQVTVQVYA
jgi:outer membrane murein-binding lipoprotein Lpp